MFAAIRIGLGLIMAFLLLAEPPARAAVPKETIRIVVGEDGLVSLKAGTLEFFKEGPQQNQKEGQLRVSRAVLRDWDGTERNGDVGKHTTTWDPQRRTLTQTFGWSVIRCTYTASEERMVLAVHVANTSSAILQGLSFSLASLHLPTTAAHGLTGPGQMLPSVDAPGIALLDWGSGTLAFCNEDVGRPLYVGLLAAAGDPKAVGLQVATFREDRFPRGWLTTPKIDRPIYPNGTDDFTLSLRFGESGATQAQMAADIIRKYALAYPLTSVWKDRRPIGTLHLGAVEYRQPQNPRGWFDKDGGVDTTTEAGRAAFRDRVLRYADASVAVLKDMDAQGMIVWDIEGNEYPHATTYLGDPRSHPAEIEPVLDAFFKKFTDAGVRVGLCIRPSLPARPLYGEEARQIQSDDPVFLLNEKIAYARKRWGCSIFYIDSNVVYDPRFKPSDGAGYELLPATIFQRVAAANPDTLLLPEQKDARYYAYTTPYMEFRQGYVGTPENVRALYPNSFSAIYVPDGPIAERRAELVAAAKRGDILMFRAWWPDPVNAKIKSIYAEAHK